MVSESQTQLPRRWNDDLLACPNCGNATPPQCGKCCDVQCRVELYRWRKSRDKKVFLKPRHGQFVRMMEREVVGIKKHGVVVMKSVVRPKTVWVGDDKAPTYGESLIVERPEMKPRPVRHLVDHNDRPEVPEPTPTVTGWERGEVEHKARRSTGRLQHDRVK